MGVDLVAIDLVRIDLMTLSRKDAAQIGTALAERVGQREVGGCHLEG